MYVSLPVNGRDTGTSINSGDSRGLLDAQQQHTPSPPEQQHWHAAPPPIWAQFSYFIVVVAFLIYFLVDRWAPTPLLHALAAEAHCHGMC